MIDIMMQSHHDAFMRTTIDLPEDLHRIASSLSRSSGRSLGQTVADLMRRGLEAPARRVEDARAIYHVDQDTGLPIIVGATRPMTEDDVRALEDTP